MQEHLRAGRKRIELLVAAASSSSQPPSVSKAKANVEAATTSKRGNDAEGTKDEGRPLPAAAPMFTSCGGSGRARWSHAHLVPRLKNRWAILWFRLEAKSRVASDVAAGDQPSGSVA